MTSHAAKFTDSDKPILNIVAVGAHPDDPETGCGGTLAKLAAEGHTISILYLTKGEAGVKGVSFEEAGRIRSAESESACAILGAKPFFLGQVDANTEINCERYQLFHDRLMTFDPDIVFTHWPLDTHIDHRTAAMLAYQSWLWTKEKFVLAYYEVMPGLQSHHFQPDVFIDIAATRDQKWQAIYAHTSQNPAQFHPYHDHLEGLRGKEMGVDCAEAFVVLREKLPKPFAV
jgi:LmbE family N-acetylglucosaminyl deacetylase